MGDQLEQFIVKNKEAFNDAEPSEKVWTSIDKKLQRKHGFLQVAWKVAAVLFMVSTLYLLVDKNLQEDEVPQFSEEFQQAEDYYVQLINVRRLEIQDQLTPDQHEEFLQEIDQLDELYLELKETYLENALSERVMDAMINNLQLRLDILNKQLEILENIKIQRDENEPNIEI